MGALRPVVFHACNSATLDLESKSQLEVWFDEGELEWVCFGALVVF